MAQYQNLGDDLSSIFPEQTKAIPRIIVWSIIFIIDLGLAAFLVFQTGLIDLLDGKLGSLLVTGLTLIVAGGLFWAESLIWKTILRLFR